METSEELVKVIVSRVLDQLGQGGRGGPSTAEGGTARASGIRRGIASSATAVPAAGPVGGTAAMGPADGVFERVEDAVSAAVEAQRLWARTPPAARRNVIEALRQVTHRHAEDFSRRACLETGMGRIEDKILKHHNAADHTPGVEDLESRSWSDDRGVALEEYAPYGVIAAVTPSTHPIPVLLNSIITTIAAGNTTVFSVHPAAKHVSAYAMGLFCRAVREAGGPAGLIGMLREPTMEAVGQLFAHPAVSLIVATGGPSLVEAAFRSGKKVIAAGPGNPPVLVDHTACPDRAARAIIEGAGFDNNILCIAEKEIFVVEKAWDRFLAAMERAGAVRLNRLQVQALTEKAFRRSERGHWVVNRDLVGKNASVLAQAAGILGLPEQVRILFGETDFDHPFVQEEQMMPFLPVVRVRDGDEGIRMAAAAEHGYRHTAMIHSHDLDLITRYAQALDTSIVVVNGSSLAGNGPPAGAGYFSHTISSPTGEGVCTPRNFARVRRLSVQGALRFV